MNSGPPGHQAQIDSSTTRRLHAAAAPPEACPRRDGHRGTGLPQPGTGSIGRPATSFSPGRAKEDVLPTAIDRDFLDLRVSDVRRIAHDGRDHHVVVLQEPEGGRRLPIWIGPEHALELALRLLGHGPQLARPLASDLAARLVHALGGSLREVRIDRLTAGTYYAVIVVDGPHGSTEVDARPSDALTLALVVGAPVRAERAVVDTTEFSAEVAQTLAAIDSQDAAGPQALLDELAAEAQRQDPPEPASS